MARTTKAQTVLREAEAHLNVARLNLANAEGAVSEARAVLNALQTNYDYMVKALAPKPRGKSTPAPSAEKKSRQRQSQPKLVPSTEASAGNASTASKPASELCQACGNDEMFTDHFEPSPAYHEFQGKKSKASAA